MIAVAKWVAADVADQRGRTVIITGANSGLGAEMTRVLAGAGARVVAACRDIDRASAFARTVVGEVEVRHLDLADLARCGPSRPASTLAWTCSSTTPVSWAFRRAARPTASNGTSVPTTSGRSSSRTCCSTGCPPES
ncbi:SDR family NAD(P)-dependent oxidoreductase [Oerskovia sp. M15]